MAITSYHAKYFSHDLTRRSVNGIDRLSMSLFDAAVDLNPHQIKADRGWYNLNLTRTRMIELLTDRGWYQLLIQAEELAFDLFSKVNQWEEIAISLLKKYTERYYTFRKREWELPHLEYRELESNDPNLLGVGKEVGEARLDNASLRYFYF